MNTRTHSVRGEMVWYMTLGNGNMEADIFPEVKEGEGRWEAGAYRSLLN